MATITKTILAKGKWGKNFTTGRGGKKVQFIVLHNTATTASALNNLKYFASRYVGASAHYFIDRDGKIYQSVLETDTAWSVGASKYKHASARNSNTINIEMVSAGTEFTQAQKETLSTFVPELLNKYGLPGSAVLRHYDVTGKRCPSWYTASSARWSALKSRILLQRKSAPKPVAPVASKPAATGSFYPKYTGSSGSITAALTAVKVDSSYANRKKIAALNGIKNYAGTAAQNTALLKLLKKGALKKTATAAAPKAPTVKYYARYKGSSDSIVAALNAVKVASSYANRKKIAAANGIKDYKGTAAQNTKMLALLKQGKLKK